VEDTLKEEMGKPMGSEEGDVHKDDVLNNSIMLEGPGSIRQDWV
jgi:hypothetical protein